MITVTKKWRRYCGPRSELVRATRLAADVIQESTGVDSTVEVELDDRRGTTEKASSVDALMARHPTELADLETIAITVNSDTMAWVKEHYTEEEGVPAAPAGPVRIRVSQHGTTLAVSGEDRTRVEGLSRQLADVIGRAATDTPGFPRDALILLGSAIAVAGSALGVVVGRWLGVVGDSEGRVALDETLAFICGTLVGASIGAALWWLFPEVEILDEGGAGRARRFRKWIIGVGGALVLAVVGSFVYDQVK